MWTISCNKDIDWRIAGKLAEMQQREITIIQLGPVAAQMHDGGHTPDLGETDEEHGGPSARPSRRQTLPNCSLPGNRSKH
jgi:hypothetical protein